MSKSVWHQVPLGQGSFYWVDFLYYFIPRNNREKGFPESFLVIPWWGWRILIIAILVAQLWWCRLGIVPSLFVGCFLGRLWGLQDLLHEAEIPGRHVPGTKMPNCWKMTIDINVPAGSLHDIAANPPFWIAKHIFKVSMFHFYLRLLEGSWKMKHFDVGQVLHWWWLKR